MTTDKEARNRQLSAKTSELQSQLEVWAKDSNILMPGERLVFSLRLESISTVVQETVNYNDMLAGKFFSKSRLMASGASKSLAQRISLRMYYNRMSSMPMSEFIEKTSLRELRSEPNFGPECIKAIVSLLAEAGMELSDHGNDY